MSRQLIEYLPYVIRDYDAFKAMAAGWQPEFDKAWACADDLQNNRYISTSNAAGLAQWEKILDITPKGTDSLEDSRFRILARINEKLPYTFFQLINFIGALCGSDYSVTRDLGFYTIHVSVGLENKEHFETIRQMLERVVPMNMVIQLDYLYNTHAMLEGMTYAEMEAYTYEQLREEILF